MKTFIYKLFSDGGEISSKRFIAIIGACVLFTCILYVVFLGKPIDYHVYDGLILVVLGAAGITAFEKVKLNGSMAQWLNSSIEKNEVSTISPKEGLQNDEASVPQS
jgi:uncharacterized membrane protein